MKTKPDLGIKNPYALDETQFDAAVDLLKQQKPRDRPVLGHYPRRDRRVRATATWNVGTTWQIITNRSRARPGSQGRRASSRPEGATGWSDTWMINSKTKHPHCAYK